jgi:hypothetical protein
MVGSSGRDPIGESIVAGGSLKLDGSINELFSA